MLISEIRDKVSQGLLDFAWRQWAQVGVSATVGGADRWAVDPEALILKPARQRPQAGFAKRNISDVLTSLMNSGVIKAAWAGNGRHFTAYRERWAPLLDLADPADMPSFVSWVHLLPAALEIARIRRNQQRPPRPAGSRPLAQDG